MQTNTMVAILKVHDVILICDDCPHTYRRTSYRPFPLFALTIRHKLSNKPDAENRTLDCYTACLQIWVHIKIKVAIPAAARSKLWVCGRSLAGIGGSKPAGRMDVCYECCVVRIICDRPITRPEESYRMCVCVFVCICPWVWPGATIILNAYNE
jgi:hypothetical protein